MPQNFGWVENPKEVEAQMKSLPFPMFGDVWEPIKGTGVGKILMLTDIIAKVAGIFPYRNQTIGDCFNPSALVRMDDGSEKPIIDVKIGEHVLTPLGNRKKVIDFIKKPYSKSMVRIHVAGYKKPIESTPDHLYMSLPNIGRGCKGDKSFTQWKSAVGLNEGDYILLPKLPSNNSYSYDLNDYVINSITHESNFKLLRTKEVSLNKIRAKSSHTEVNRFIKLDEKLAWLIGIYAAEGGIDNGRITFNLCIDEVLLATKIVSYIKDVFDFDAKIEKIPSKPTVQYVRVQNHHISALFKHLCIGNIYSKELNKTLLLTSKEVKLQLLSGWIDGDGHKDKIGVSVSEKLVYDFFQISNSLNINSSIINRKARKQSKKSYSLNLNNGCELLTQQSLSLKLNQKQVTKYGKAAKITKIEIVKAETDYVYCIGVEDDHAFICNGYGVHNCVSMGAAYAVDAAKAVDIFLKKDPEEWIAETSTEDIYAGSRVIIGKGQLSGDGSFGIWAAKWVNEYGALARGKYADIDLSTYSGSRARQWGSRNVGVPKQLLDTIRKHPISTISKVTSYAQARDLLANGYPITIASNQGFTSIRDKDGFARPSGSWAHQMSLLGIDDSSGRPGCLVQNSWGRNWISGPKKLNQPDGSFWVDADVLERLILSKGDSWAFGGYEGFPKKEIRLDII